MSLKKNYLNIDGRNIKILNSLNDSFNIFTISGFSHQKLVYYDAWDNCKLFIEFSLVNVNCQVQVWYMVGIFIVFAAAHILVLILLSQADYTTSPKASVTPVMIFQTRR